MLSTISHIFGQWSRWRSADAYATPDWRMLLKYRCLCYSWLKNVAKHWNVGFVFFFSFLTFKFLNKDTDLDSRRFFWHATTMMGQLSDIYIRFFQKVLLISHLYSFVLVSYMIQKSVFIYLVISGVSTVLWHLSESAVLTDFQEIKPKYFKINATANKNQSKLYISYLFLSFASPVFPTGKLCSKL